MNLLVVGATGHGGRLVTQQALSRGHSVTAFVRTPSLTVRDRLKIVVGDPRRIENLLEALPGHDAVISCLGNPTATDRGLVTNSALAMLAAMNKLKMKRYVILSGGLLFPSMNPAVWILRTMLAAKLADAREMELLVRTSDLDWTIVRPPHLKDGVQPVGYRTKVGGRTGRKWSMQFIDLADLLLDAVEQRKFIREIVGVGPA